MEDKYVKAIKDEILEIIKNNRLIKSAEVRNYTDGLERALSIIKKQERREAKYKKNQKSEVTKMTKEIGCTQCPYAGHIELKECPDAYTEASQHCGLYKHEPMQKGGRRDNEG